MNQFSQALILIQPDPNKHLIVEIDASETGVGSVVLQCSSADNKLHPCAALSHRLSPGEHNCDVGDKEFSAKLLVEECCHWLTIGTDPCWSGPIKISPTVNQSNTQLPTVLVVLAVVLFESLHLLLSRLQESQT